MIKNKLFATMTLVLIFSCSTLPNNYSFDDALENGIKKIQDDLPENSDIAILDFKSDNASLSSYVIEEIYDKLINGRKLKVMERSRIDTISQEVGYQLSGEVDDNEIINIGHQLGADFVVTGQITFSGESYRLRVFAIDIEKGQRIASSSLNINSNDRQIKYLLTMDTQSSTTQENNIAGTSWTTFYVDEDEFDEMFILVFGKNTVRVDEIEYELPDELRSILPFSIYDVGPWSQTGKNVNVKFNESIWYRNSNLVNEVFWELKLAIIDEKTMEGTILHNGELIGNAELYKK